MDHRCLGRLGLPARLASDGEVTAKARSPLMTKTMSSVEFQKASSPNPSMCSELASSSKSRAASARVAKVCTARSTLGSASAAYSQMASPAPPAIFIGCFIAAVTSASPSSWQADASAPDPLTASVLVWLASMVAGVFGRIVALLVGVFGRIVALLVLALPPPHPLAMTATATATTAARALRRAAEDRLAGPRRANSVAPSNREPT